MVTCCDSVNRFGDQSAHVSRSWWARFGKRPFDFVVALILLVALSPVLLLTALAVKLTSRGPLFFFQERTGLNGNPFYPRKFRSMRTDHRHDTSEIVPITHSAITPVGRFIRRFKLDELPQLWCILIGEMSLVGPRPTIPEQTRQYDEYQWRRLLVRPGGTGLAQVNSSPLRSWEDRIHYDVHYARHHNLRMDLAILAKTIFVVIAGEERFARPFNETPYVKKLTDSVPQKSDPQP